MPNYQNGKIYMIRSDKTDQVYIGSTTMTLKDRMSCHRSEFKRNCANTTSRQILQYPDACIVLIELYPCETKEELNAREQYWINEHSDIACNINRAHRTEEDLRADARRWREDNPDYHRRWIEENRERLTEVHKCACGGKYQTRSKVKHENCQMHQQWVEAQQRAQQQENTTATTTVTVTTTVTTGDGVTTTTTTTTTTKTTE